MLSKGYNKSRVQTQQSYLKRKLLCLGLILSHRQYTGHWIKYEHRHHDSDSRGIYINKKINKIMRDLIESGIVH